jgi:hypothetical protein
VESRLAITNARNAEFKEKETGAGREGAEAHRVVVVVVVVV